MHITRSGSCRARTRVEPQPHPPRQPSHSLLHHHKHPHTRNHLHCDACTLAPSSRCLWPRRASIACPMHMLSRTDKPLASRRRRHSALYAGPVTRRTLIPTLPLHSRPHRYILGCMRRGLRCAWRQRDACVLRAERRRGAKRPQLEERQEVFVACVVATGGLEGGACGHLPCPHLRLELLPLSGGYLALQHYRHGVRR